MATIYKRGTRYYLNWSEAGAQYRRSLGAIERGEAEAIRAEKDAELHGLLIPTRGVLVCTVLDDYLAWYQAERPTTYRRAVSALKPFRLAFDGAAAESLPPLAIQQWASGRTAKGSTEKALKLARAAFRRAVEQRVIARSPMVGVAIPKLVVSRAPPYYSREQLRALARAEDGALWIFAAATGLRRGELAKADQARDVRDGVLVVESTAEGRTKSGKWRAVPLNRYALWALRRLPAARLAPWHRDTLGDKFTAQARAAGLPGSIHWLRHTFCTILVQSGTSLHEVQRLAGHSSVTVTEQYAHHAPDYGRLAVGTMGRWGRGRKA